MIQDRMAPVSDRQLITERRPAESPTGQDRVAEAQENVQMAHHFPQFVQGADILADQS